MGLEDASTGKRSWLWHVAQVGGWVGEGVGVISSTPQWGGAMHVLLARSLVWLLNGLRQALDPGK